MLSCFFTEVKKLLDCPTISFFLGGEGGSIFFSSTIIDEGLVESLFFLEFIIFFIPCHKTFELFLLC